MLFILKLLTAKGLHSYVKFRKSDVEKLLQPNMLLICKLLIKKITRTILTSEHVAIDIKHRLD